MAYKFQLGTSRLSGSITPTDDQAFDLGASGREFKDLYIDGTAYLDAIDFNGTAISATAAELNKLASCNVTTAELNKLASSDSNSAANKMIILDANGDFEMQDSDKIFFGNDADVSIHWDGDSLEIGTDNSGKAINIGHGTSEVTFGDNVTITGDLTINGTTTTVNSTTIEITSSFTFEGSTPDANETVFGVTNPTADTTINLPAMSAGTYHVPVLSAASTTAISATPEELNVLDGLAQGSILIGDGSGAAAIVDAKTSGQILVGNGTTLASVALSGDATLSAAGALTIADDAVESGMLNDNVISGQTDIGAAIVATDEILISDNGTLRRTDVSRLKTYIQAGVNVYKLSGSGTVDGIIAATSGSGFYYNAGVEDDDGLAYESVYMISGSNWTVGAEVKIKTPELDSGGKISIYAQSSSLGDFIHSIDGIQSDTSGSNMSQLGTAANDIPAIVLESNNAAVTLVLYDDATDGGTINYQWAIM